MNYTPQTYDEQNISANKNVKNDAVSIGLIMSALKAQPKPKAAPIAPVIEITAKREMTSGLDILTKVFPDPVEIVPGIIPAGLTILAARPKEGKSWLALQIAKAMEAGGLVLNRPVMQGRVLYLALEDNERRLQDRMKKQGWTRAEASNVDFMTLGDFQKKIGFLHSGGDVKIKDYVQKYHYRLVVVDTLSRAFIGLRDMDSNQEVTRALSPIQLMAMDTGIGVLMIDHHTKPKQFNPNPIDDIMGSTAKGGVVDTAIGIYKNADTKSVQLMAKGKDIEDIDIVLEFDPITWCWQSMGNASTFVKNINEKKVLEVLMQSEGMVTLSYLEKETGIPKSHCATNISLLVDKGLVKKIVMNNVTKGYEYVGGDLAGALKRIGER